MKRYLLALDYGGTKCEAIVVRDDGTIVGWGRSDFSTNGNVDYIQSKKISAEQALEGIHCDELHVGQYHGDYSRFDELLGNGVTARNMVPHVVTEHDGILELAGYKNGINASAGTGSFVYGITKDGRKLHLDSLGPVLGDIGGASDIGIRAIQAAARSEWHPRHQTSLTDIVYATLGIRKSTLGVLGNSLVWKVDFIKDRAIIASLARFVDAEAKNGDKIANTIIFDAALALSETVYDVYDCLRMKDEGYHLVGAGSVIEKSNLYWQHLCDHVHKFAPELIMVRTDLPHVVGTALAMLDQLPDNDAKAAKSRLIKLARERFPNVQTSAGC